MSAISREPSHGKHKNQFKREEATKDGVELRELKHGMLCDCWGAYQGGVEKQWAEEMEWGFSKDNMMDGLDP